MVKRRPKIRFNHYRNRVLYIVYIMEMYVLTVNVSAIPKRCFVHLKKIMSQNGNVF